jgi:sterol desaturase/sphingolipid hydroxylase (fatty acid hydroxylase superfamily)
MPTDCTAGTSRTGHEACYEPNAMALIEFTDECVAAANHKWPGIEPGSKRKDRPIAIKVLKNNVLENVFSRAHWVTPIIWFGGLIAFGLYRGATDPVTAGPRLIGYFLFGWLLWTFAEYMLHRFIFHMEAKNESERMRVFLAHGYHHDFPDDPMRLVAPPLMSWGPAVIFAVVYYFAFGRHQWLPIIAGTATGYVAYDWIHYYTHHGRPTGGIGKWLRKYHMKHHFKDGNAWYGVSTPIWDFVFGTYKSKKENLVEAQEH